MVVNLCAHLPPHPHAYTIGRLSLNQADLGPGVREVRVLLCLATQACW